MQLAERTKNYTGAEIESVCQKAASYMLFRDTDITKLEKLDMTEIESRQITMEDFEIALNEVKPQFGVDDASIEGALMGGFTKFSQPFQNLLGDVQSAMSYLTEATHTQMQTVCIFGAKGTGKTAFSSYLAQNSGYPFIKVLNTEGFIGLNHFEKCKKIN